MFIHDSCRCLFVSLSFSFLFSLSLSLSQTQHSTFNIQHSNSLTVPEGVLTDYAANCCFALNFDIPKRERVEREKEGKRGKQKEKDIRVVIVIVVVLVIVIVIVINHSYTAYLLAGLLTYLLTYYLLITSHFIYTYIYYILEFSCR